MAKKDYGALLFVSLAFQFLNFLTSEYRKGNPYLLESYCQILYFVQFYLLVCIKK